MADVMQGVDAGIGAAAALNADWNVAEKPSEPLFDRLLDGESVRLSLPAVVVGAVEGDFHFESELFFHFSPG